MAAVQKPTYFDVSRGPTWQTVEMWQENAKILNKIAEVQNTRDMEDSKKINELLKEILKICHS